MVFHCFHRDFKEPNSFHIQGLLKGFPLELNLVFPRNFLNEANPWKFHWLIREFVKKSFFLILKRSTRLLFFKIIEYNLIFYRFSYHIFFNYLNCKHFNDAFSRHFLFPGLNITIFLRLKFIIIHNQLVFPCIVSSLPVRQWSVLRRLLSNNDNNTTHSRYIYTERKEGEREQDTGETERECVCARGRVGSRRGGVGRKNNCWRDGLFRIKIEGLF